MKQPINGKTTRPIHVGVDKGSLRIQFSRPISIELFGQKQKYLYLQLSDTPENRLEADKIALQIENDIRAHKLEKDLKIYLPVNQLKKNVGLFYDPNRIHLTTIELFTKFCHFIKPQLQVTTYELTYQKRYRPIFEKAPQNLNEQSRLVDYIYHNCCGETFLDLCSLLYRMLDWANKRGLVPKESVNQFNILKEDYKVTCGIYKPGILVTRSISNYTHDYDYRGFSREDAQTIIKAFEDYTQVGYVKNRRTGLFTISNDIRKVRETARDYIKLKFWTGCRSGEATALRWLDIAEDFEYIVFKNTYSSKLRLLKPLKTEKVGREGTESRKFPCGEKLRLLLEDRYKRCYQGNPEDFIFCSRTGLPFHTDALTYHWYGKEDRVLLKNRQEEKFDRLGVVTQLVVDKKIAQYLKSYATRHTWITLQLLSGVHINNIAKLAGNSPQTIMENYSSYVPNMSLATEI